ncbi:MAG: hypothetical protein Kow0069_34090 [Promethearchaeota archaeon]
MTQARAPTVHVPKLSTRHAVKCPACGEILHPGVEIDVLKSVCRFPYPHVLLHGSPLHAMVAYIDAQGNVRGVEASHSVEVSRDGRTFSQLVTKWSNPF